jgi:hypothetical protein
MTAWVFDNVGETEIQEIETQIEAAGGKIEDEVRKLEKGGAVAKLESTTAAAAMSIMADWCAKKKIRIHLPKPLLRGTVPIVVKNMSIDYAPQIIVDVFHGEGVEIMELYVFKNSLGQPTGTIKATVKGSNKVKAWLETGKGEIGGARILVDRQRTPMACFNCNKIGHRAADCKDKKKCKRCGQADHLKADCKADAEELADKCSYCFENNHSKGECQKKRVDERAERQQFKAEKKDPVLENVWKEIPAFNKANYLDDNENKKELEVMLAEMKTQLQAEMKTLQQETMRELVKSMMTQMKENMMEMTKEITKEMQNQQQQWQQQQQQQQQQQWQQWQQQQQQNQQQQPSTSDRHSASKRQMETPKQQKGENKKTEGEEVLEGKAFDWEKESEGEEDDDMGNAAKEATAATAEPTAKVAAATAATATTATTAATVATVATAATVATTTATKPATRAEQTQRSGKDKRGGEKQK